MNAVQNRSKQVIAPPGASALRKVKSVGPL